MGFPLKPLNGLWGFPPFSNATRCAPGECSAHPDWELPLDVALHKVGRQPAGGLLCAAAVRYSRGVVGAAHKAVAGL